MVMILINHKWKNLLPEQHLDIDHVQQLEVQHFLLRESNHPLLNLESFVKRAVVVHKSVFLFKIETIIVTNKKIYPRVLPTTLEKGLSIKYFKRRLDHQQHLSYMFILNVQYAFL